LKSDRFRNRRYHYRFNGKRYDVGEKLGFAKTTIEFALQNEELREELATFLKEIVKTLP
jgi:UTP--glucose-1-phosphate uridylyltransferase